MTTIGEKAAHVRAALPDGRHDCHWPGCGKIVPPAKWGCSKHWFMLPLPIRRRIWNTYRIGQEDTKTPSREYVEAARAAQDWIAENHPPERTLL